MVTDSLTGRISLEPILCVKITVIIDIMLNFASALTGMGVVSICVNRP